MSSPLLPRLQSTQSQSSVFRFSPRKLHSQVAKTGSTTAATAKARANMAWIKNVEVNERLCIDKPSGMKAARF